MPCGNCSKLTAATYTISVSEPFSGQWSWRRGDRQLQGWRYSRRTGRGARFQEGGGMVIFNEKADAKGVMKAVYNNPLDI